MTSTATSHQFLILILLILLYAGVDGGRHGNDEQVTTPTPPSTTQQVKVNDVTSSNVEYGNFTNKSCNDCTKNSQYPFPRLLRANIHEEILDARSLEIIVFSYVCFLVIVAMVGLLGVVVIACKDDFHARRAQHHGYQTLD